MQIRLDNVYRTNEEPELESLARLRTIWELSREVRSHLDLSILEKKKIGSGNFIRLIWVDAIELPSHEDLIAATEITAMFRVEAPIDDWQAFLEDDGLDELAKAHRLARSLSETWASLSLASWLSEGCSPSTRIWPDSLIRLKTQFGFVSRTSLDVLFRLALLAVGGQQDEAPHLLARWAYKVEPSLRNTEMVKDFVRNHERHLPFFDYTRMLRPAEEATETSKPNKVVTDDLLKSVSRNHEALARLYKLNPEIALDLVSDDTAAESYLLNKRRKRGYKRFSSLLTQRSSEPEWQSLFNQHPWMLGATLSSHLAISWRPERLQQSTGKTPDHNEKIPDAILRTAAELSVFVFVELKRPDTRLLGSEHRTGAWAPSSSLVEAINQIQVSVSYATENWSSSRPNRDGYGQEIPASRSFLHSPRAYVIVGETSQLKNQHGALDSNKVRSFELFRRGLRGVEILTYDELKKKVQWHAQSVEHSDNLDA